MNTCKVRAVIERFKTLPGDFREFAHAVGFVHLKIDRRNTARSLRCDELLVSLLRKLQRGLQVFCSFFILERRLTNCSKVEQASGHLHGIVFAFPIADRLQIAFFGIFEVALHPRQRRLRHVAALLTVTVS